MFCSYPNYRLLKLPSSLIVMGALVMWLVFATHQLKAQDTLNVFFATNSTDVQSEQQDRLFTWLNEMAFQKEDSFALLGYTDDRGTIEYNKKLSYERAMSVRGLLVKSGVGEDAITRVEGVGNAVPLASNETEMGRSQNRRVAILHFTYEMKMAIRAQQSRGDQLAKEDSLAEIEVEDLGKVAEVDCSQESKVIEAENGVEVVLGPCCLDKIGDDISVQVQSIYTRKEFLLNEVVTMDIDGDCLETDGMVIVKVVDGKGKPLKLQDSCMKLRMPVNEQDAEKRIYYAIFGKDSTGFAWQSTYKTPAFDSTSQASYYEIDLDDSRGVAIQKMVPNSRKHRHDPKIWVDIKPYTKENARVFLSTEDVVLAGFWNEKNACYFRRGCVDEHFAYLTVVATNKDGHRVVAHQPLRKTTFKGNKDKGKYVIRKEDFVKITSSRAMSRVIKF
ncbi:MAG: OmpA family protein [Bacteroidota bacterium]